LDLLKAPYGFPKLGKQTKIILNFKNKPMNALGHSRFLDAHGMRKFLLLVDCWGVCWGWLSGILGRAGFFVSSWLAFILLGGLNAL
jgi:hypothetical protein